MRPSGRGVTSLVLWRLRSDAASALASGRNLRRGACGAPASHSIPAQGGEKRRRSERGEGRRKEEKGGERRSKHSRLGVEEPVRRSVRPVLEQNERADEEGFSIPGDAHLEATST